MFDLDQQNLNAALEDPPKVLTFHCKMSLTELALKQQNQQEGIWYLSEYDGLHSQLLL